MESVITLRPAQEKDWPWLNAFCYSEGMDNLPSLENVTVAADGDDDAVGFIRIAFSPEGVAHVNPVVVNPNWRGFGLGRILTENALATYGELRLVARGSAVPFYRALGFEEVPWEDITMAVTEDCDHCDMRDECGPLPMRKVL